MVIAMVVMLVVALMGFESMGTVSNVGWATFNQAYSSRKSALAISELRAEVVSGNIIFDPSSQAFNPTGGYDGSSGTDCETQVSENAGDGTNCAGNNPDGAAIPPGYSLLIYTQTNSVYQCVQWRLLETGVLQVRQWTTPWQFGDAVPSWVTLLSGITNYSSSTAPFVLDPGSNYGTPGRLLDVDLVFDSQTHIQTSIAGRDAWYYPTDTGDCAPEPPPS
ncbi:MAG: hypothetical protein ACRD6W_02930 [Nitrososphaerales archaeon]